MKRFFFIPSLILLFLISCSEPPKENVNIIPKPNSLEISRGKFIINNSTKVLYDDKIENVNNIVAYLNSLINSSAGFNLEISKDKNATSNFIFFKYDENIKNEESYNLISDKNGITISASDSKGIFYGVQTLIQLLPAEIFSQAKINFELFVPSVIIKDEPRFSWRGLNLDCGRHFMSKDFIKRYIDILASYKFNTFHWHLTEDQGWRIEIKKYPKLTEIGAWRKEADGSTYGGFYTQDDIKEIVNYAQSRFINIVPEIEMPGHSLASLASYPENSCTGGPFEVTNIWGVHKDVYCAGKESTFIFLQNILDEVIELFPSKYIHIGGDEVPKDRWKACKNCQARIKTENLKNEHELQSYFIKRISNYLEQKGKHLIGWDEILEGGLAPGAIVQSWQSFKGAVDAAKQQNYSICSPASHTYLNNDPEDLDLRTAYSFNPIPTELNETEKKYILGSEVNLWTENAPQETVDSKLFPRILALTEVFWSDEKDRSFDDFYSRVKDAYTDLTFRNIKYGQESKSIIYTTKYDKAGNTFTVKLKPAQQGIEIFYTIDNSQPTLNSLNYKDPIKIVNTTNLRVGAFLNKNSISKEIQLSFGFHKALNAKLTLTNKYEEQYRANGDNGILDGLRGTLNFRDGLWQGYEGKDFEAIIDLEKNVEIYEVSPRFILNTNSWIFFPEYVEISLSEDGKNFTELKKIVNDIPQKNPDIITKDFTANYENISARYVKVKAKNIEKCPVWHPGAGGKTWVFIDEIIIN